MRGEGLGSWDNYLTVNVDGTRILSQWALDRGVKKFIFISTAGVYGTIPSTNPAQEDGPINADMFYHKSKWMAEESLRDTIQDKIDLYILRPTTTYGRGDDGFMYKLIEMVKEKKFVLMRKPILIHLLDVNYFVKIILELISSKENRLVINIADNKPVELQQLVDLISYNFSKKKYPKLHKGYASDAGRLNRIGQWYAAKELLLTLIKITK